MIYWIVKFGNMHVIVNGLGRETAKTNAAFVLGGNPDAYTVTPLTLPGDRLWINIGVAG